MLAVIANSCLLKEDLGDILFFSAGAKPEKHSWSKYYVVKGGLEEGSRQNK